MHKLFAIYFLKILYTSRIRILLDIDSMEAFLKSIPFLVTLSYFIFIRLFCGTHIFLAMY